MTANAAELPRETTAWDILANEMPTKAEYLPEDRDPRYFFYAGDEPGVRGAGGLRTQSKCIPGLMIKRAFITPCVTVQIPSRIQEIPEGKLIRGTENYLPGLGRYWLYSGPEAFVLIQKYGNRTDWKANRGLIELDFLRGMEPSKVQALKITECFFPEYPKDVPETNAGLAQHIAKVRDAIRANEYAFWKWSPTDSDSIVKRDIYLRAADYMIRAVESAHRWQSATVNQSNLAITLPSTEPGYKRDFDEADEIYSRRTGISLAVNSLRQNAILQDVVKDAPKGVDAEAIAAIVAATVRAVKAADEPAAVAPTPEVEDAKPAPKGRKAA